MPSFLMAAAIRDPFVAPRIVVTMWASAFAESWRVAIFARRDRLSQPKFRRRCSSQFQSLHRVFSGVAVTVVAATRLFPNRKRLVVAQAKLSFDNASRLLIYQRSRNFGDNPPYQTLEMAICNSLAQMQPQQSLHKQKVEQHLKANRDKKSELTVNLCLALFVTWNRSSVERRRTD